MPTYGEVRVALAELRAPNDVALRLQGSRAVTVRVVGEGGELVPDAFGTVGFGYVRPPLPRGFVVREKGLTRSTRFPPYEYFATQSLVGPKDDETYTLFVYDSPDRDLGIFSPEGAAVIKRSEIESFLSGAEPRTIRLGADEFVAGTVVDSRGEPVAGCHVELRLENGEIRVAETFRSGTYYLYTGGDEAGTVVVLPGDGSEIRIGPAVPGVREIVEVE
jgi:hypothetical protein